MINPIKRLIAVSFPSFNVLVIYFLMFSNLEARRLIVIVSGLMTQGQGSSNPLDHSI